MQPHQVAFLFLVILVMPNKLINESSPYLLQHAHNPVDWYPWGNEALALAKKEDKPILVSIGYSACHWCHVMENESFEDAAVAAIMNKNFICIKIDREERPDLDHFYMDAVQAISGSGGWPLNVFLTPGARPFYGGTYFPPQKLYNRSSWTDVLNAITDIWNNKKHEATAQADNLVSHIQNSNISGAIQNLVPTKHNEIFSEKICLLIAENLLKNSDAEWGGFGQPPKFLQMFSLQFLLEHACFFKDEKSIAHVNFSLEKMLKGGIYDQLGGGIARYSTDAQWLVPHFEKMLYDNALLLQNLADIYLSTKNNSYLYYIRHMDTFLETTLKNPQGGYYTALDADSEGIEGQFYVWNKKEIERLLKEDAPLYCSYFNISNKGNWEGKNILHVSQPMSAFAGSVGLSTQTLFEKIEKCNTILLSNRNKRIKPGTDDKIILSYNALLVTAYCKAFAATQQDEIKVKAIELFQFLETAFKGKNGGLLHTSKNGISKFLAFLDDYAYFIKACISLQEITGDEQYLHQAHFYLKYVIENYSDEQNLFFYFTGKLQQDILVRKTEVYDSVMPSSNAVMAENLIYLSIVFNIPAYKERAVNMISSLQKVIKDYPASFAYWAVQLQRLAIGLNEVAIVGESYLNILKKILYYFVPNKVLGGGKAGDLPLLSNKPVNKNDTYIYVCRNYSCERPVKSVADALKLLKFNKG